MPTRRGTLSRPRVGRDPRNGQGEILGAEKSAPDLAVIPGGHAKKVPNRIATHASRATCKTGVPGSARLRARFAGALRAVFQALRAE
eukprot:6486587-Prymnesium_polylepis.1